MILRALAFVCGDLALQQFSKLPPVSALVIISALAAIMARLRYWHCLFFIIGFLWASTFGYYQLHDRLLPEFEGIPLTISGEIANLPDQDKQRANFEFIILKSDKKLPDKIKLSWYNPTAILRAGETWTFTVKLKRPHANFNLGGQDFESWLFTQSIGATGTVYAKNSLPIFVEPASFSINSLRQKIGDTLTQRYGDNVSVALLKALTIGDDNGLSSENWDTFRITGTTHLIVISGSHIALVAGLVYWLTLKLWASFGTLRVSPPHVAALTSLFAAMGYASLAGYVIPTKRAVIMIGMRSEE
ncbi:MAG: ComEC/Rec2 family competence protein, partial [Methylococcales bacterium]|nr:ComEC/Rec2 family competence protein [Methylococcales bacterium]